MGRLRISKAGRVRAAPCALAALGLSLIGCASLGAPGAAAPDRPGHTDTPVVMPLRAVQLEAGVTDDRVGAAGSAPLVEYRALGEALLRFGLGGRTELRLF